jgi:hypothetical protein
MQVRRVSGRSYSDPDLISLIDSIDPELGPFEFVRQRAKQLLDTLAEFAGGFDSPLQRMFALASIAGYEVREMDVGRAVREPRDAVFVPTESPGRRGLILYNPFKSQSRVLHSIAHEIVHSFFPNSNAGAQFRSLVRRSDGPPPELEQLCDHGAAELTMPLAAFQRAAAKTGLGLATINTLRRQFGTSFEATAYRIATTAQSPTAVGLFCYRAPKAQSVAKQGMLFGTPEARTPSDLKYRRQSFHYSASYPQQLVFPWNKSLPAESIVYSAPRAARIVTASEQLSAKGKYTARFYVEAVVAPYQPPAISSEWPNIIVMLKVAA